MPNYATVQGGRHGGGTSTGVSGDNNRRRTHIEPTPVDHQKIHRREQAPTNDAAEGGSREDRSKQAGSPADNFIGEFLEGDDFIAGLSDQELR